MNENQAVRVFKKSEDGRKFVAEYFANVLLRQDFTGYINEHLAADFACALADGLHALQKHCDGFAEQSAFQRDARLGALKELAIVERQRDELLAACLKTLSENGHLADGDNCTLIDIKLAIRSVKGGAA